jgi:hypothetical protein
MSTVIILRVHKTHSSTKCTSNPSKDFIIQGVSAKNFKPNNSVIFQRIFVKFKMQIF